MAAFPPPAVRAWLPNALTTARIVLAPAIFAALAGPRLMGLAQDPLTSPWPQLAAALIALAGVFDWLDGRLARAWGVESDFGRVWDAAADKFVVAAGLVGGAVLYPGMIVILPAAIIIWRDAAVTWLRRDPLRGRAIQSPSRLAKWKTTTEYVALIAVFSPAAVSAVVDGVAGPAAAGAAFLVLISIGLALLWVAAALSLITGWRYLQAARAATRAD